MEQTNKQMPIMKELETLRRKEATKGIKTRKMKIPRKAKVRRGRIKKGWIGIVKIDENGNITGEKQKVEDSTIRLKEKTYHANDGSEIGLWEGKFPVMIQQTWKKNPISIKRGDDSNETYGQKYIMARMLGDTIKVKSGGGMAIIYIVGFLVAAYVGYMAVTGQR